MIIWTLNFTVKGYVFGPTTTANVITHSIVSILENITENDQIEFSINKASGTGHYKINEIVYQGYSPTSSIATAKVVAFNGNKLSLTGINGSFVSNKQIIGLETNAAYNFTSFNYTPQRYVKIDTYTDPNISNSIPVYTESPIVDYGILNTASNTFTVIDFGGLNTSNNYTANSVITEYNNLE
jgi:hypothetical protein